MSLAQRRMVKSFQDEKLPKLTEEINEAAGFDVPMEVDWAKIGKDVFEHNPTLFEEAVTKVYFLPLIEALKEIGSDDMGKEALQAGLKKVECKNTKNQWMEQAISFKDGTLLIDHGPVMHVGKVDERKAIIVKKLENGL